MAGEALTELATAAVTDEVLEGIGNKVEDVTKQFPFLKYATVSLFFIGWVMGVYSLQWIDSIRRYRLSHRGISEHEHYV